MNVTEQTERFDRGYREGDPGWVIGEPQPAVRELERAGAVRGSVLDLGCGAGEHVALLTGLGYDVLGADASPAALERARATAAAHGVDVRLALVDALAPAGLGRFDTILDSALFHVFSPADRDRYAGALAGLCAPGAVLHLLALARTDEHPGYGPAIPRSAITGTFGRPGWAVRDVRGAVYRGVADARAAEEIGVPQGSPVDLPAWLARIERVADAGPDGYGTIAR